jgi:Protein kinase domain
MDPARWARVKTAFSAAMELPIADRAAFVIRECGDDAEVRDEVASLLAAADGSGSVPSARRTVAEAALQSVLEGVLGQQYEFIRALGHGGMGAVYLARERSLDRFVAIKVLRPELADAQAGRERFRREARVAAQLSHPGIVPLYTFGEAGGVWYYVMRYVRGVTLAERLRVEGRIPAHEAQRILLQLAEAVECAHEHGVVHRDIKPANVLLDEESGRAVLADFGIARLEGASNLTESGMVIGTPSYMSPEQAVGAGDVDERSDIYSLGAVGYAMLAGREPGRTGAGVARPAPIGDAPPALVSVITRSLAADRVERWSSASVLKRELERAGNSERGIAEPLRDLPTFGAYALLWAAIWLGIAALPGRDSGERALLALIALIVPVGLLLHLWNATDEGTTPAELARIAFWPPEWWGMWWPRALRRPNDLWPCLPWQARTTRRLLSAFIVTLPLLIVTRRWVDAYCGQVPGQCARWITSIEQVMVWGVGACVLAMLAWAFTRGLSGAESVRLLFGSTIPSPGWSRQPLASMVRSGNVLAPPAREVVADHRRAIGEAVRGLAASRAQMRETVIASSDSALARIEAIDAELAKLSRDASPGEIDRLLANAASHGAQSQRDDDEHAQLASLVKRQVDIVQGMRVRAELLTGQRRHLFSLLRGLWTQVMAASEPGDSLAVTRVEALCAELRGAAGERAGDQ